MKTYDVTSAVIDTGQVTLCLFDNRESSVIVIRAMDGSELITSEPDGSERLFWLEKFGMITEEDFYVETQKLSSKASRENLYKLLRKEFE